jgi:hypothetical protein
MFKNPVANDRQERHVNDVPRNNLDLTERATDWGKPLGIRRRDAHNL